VIDGTGNSVTTGSATCAAGSFAMGGGMAPNDTDVRMIATWPSAARTWSVKFAGPNNNGTYKVSVYVVCATPTV
jgi:hypothetical protein